MNFKVIYLVTAVVGGLVDESSLFAACAFCFSSTLSLATAYLGLDHMSVEVEPSTHSAFLVHIVAEFSWSFLGA